MCNVSGISFDNLTLKGAKFDYSDLKDASFRNAFLINVSFKSELKKVIFDGATMDKVTYAILKGNKANLDHVKVI
ncbi:pentapeptide repeat-containing protein [Paenibacillus lautus]